VTGPHRPELTKARAAWVGRRAPRPVLPQRRIARRRLDPYAVSLGAPVVRAVADVAESASHVLRWELDRWLKWAIQTYIKFFIIQIPEPFIHLFKYWFKISFWSLKIELKFYFPISSSLLFKYLFCMMLAQISWELFSYKFIYLAIKFILWDLFNKLCFGILCCN